MPPRMVSTHAIETDGGKSVLSLSACHLSGLKVRFSDGRTQLIGMKPADKDQWRDGHSLTSAGAQSFALEQGQSLNVSRKGWVFQQDGRRVDWRRVSAEIRDAVLKDGEVWMLSDDGLWRVALKNRQMTSVALPAIFGNSPFAALFQDGSTLWIRTQENQAWPLTVQGNYAMPAGRGGPVAVPPSRTKLPIADGFLDWAGPGTPLYYARPGEPRSQVLALVDTLLPLGTHTCLVGTNDTIEYWQFEGPEAKRLSVMRPGGATVRLFWEGNRILAIGRNYGIWFGRLIQKR